MDEQDLKKILENIDVPEADENAQKRAVNLAVAEFEAHQREKKQKNEKKFQGFGILSRLMGNTNKDNRRDPMENMRKKRFVYGGMATAMALVLVAGAGVLNQTVLDTIGKTEQSTILESKDQARTTGGNNFSEIAENINTGKGRKKDKGAAVLEGDARQPEPEYKKPDFEKTISEVNKRRIDEAIRNQGSAIPTPVAPAKKELRESQALGMVQQAAPAGSRQNKTMAYEQDAARMIAPAPTLPSVIAPADDIIVQPGYKDVGRDQFQDFEVNPFKLTGEEPVSTFSVDVDTAAYSFVRRQLNHGVLPQKDAVRVEEMINYFDYDYGVPEDTSTPFKPTVTVMDSPWAEGKKLMHIGIKGYEYTGDKPRTNLVFLLDVSGSMNSADKLPLVKNSMKLLLDTLNPNDTIAIAVYAGAAGTVLEPTKVSEKHKIIAALDRLSAGGSTAGAAGINLAYNLAEQNFDEEAINRVILATDGDFNVGITNREELKDFVERKREKGIFLSVLGFGQGNYNDHMMQVLAQNGNGVAAYIDNLNEARKVLVDEASSTLFPIAKDVKIQVEFNPNTVAEYRLVGYETRALNREDFNNDKVDAGDIGAGHTVTAIYEITPVGSENVSVDPLRYGSSEPQVDAMKQTHKANTDFGDEYAFLKIRYKLPEESKSKLITTPVIAGAEYKHDLTDQRFATAVAAFGQILQGGQYTGDYDFDDVIELATANKGEDYFGYRAEFVNLVRLAKSARTQ